jgi:hypothetical protein
MPTAPNVVTAQQIALRNPRVIPITITPAQITAATSAEQTFTVTGAAVGDIVVSINPPASGVAGTGIVGWRVSAADTIAIRFSNVTAGNLTPVAGVYQIAMFRPVQPITPISFEG